MEREAPETGGSVDLSYRVGRAEYLESIRAARLRRPATWIIMGVIAFLIPLAFRDPEALLVDVPLAIAWFFTITLAGWWWRRRSNLLTDIHIDDAGVRITTPLGAAELAWPAFNGGREGRRCYTIASKARFVLIIPKRTFEDPEAEQTFREIGTRHLGPHFRTLY